MSNQAIKVGGKQLDEAVFQVMRRATVDPEFRSLALKNGNAALEKISPSLIDAPIVRFLDRSNPNPISVTMDLVLPDLVEAGELSEQELEQVAGGALAIKQVHGADIQ
jgi:hypothetical protein